MLGRRLVVRGDARTHARTHSRTHGGSGVFCAVTRAKLFAQIEKVGRVDKENRKLRAELERRDEHAKLARATAESMRCGAFLDSRKSAVPTCMQASS
jgi:hypothetical protein